MINKKYIIWLNQEGSYELLEAASVSKINNKIVGASVSFMRLINRYKIQYSDVVYVGNKDNYLSTI